MHLPATPKPAVAKHNRDVATQRHLAGCLANSSRCGLLMFYSQKCVLCKAVQSQLQSQAVGDQLDLVEICADDFQDWAPEMLRYSVTTVPCLVLLDCQGELARLSMHLHRCRCLYCRLRLRRDVHPVILSACTLQQCVCMWL